MKLLAAIVAGSMLMAGTARAAGKAPDRDVDLFIKIIVCESSGNHKGVWGDDGKSYGIAQFRKETFYEFAKEAGFKNFRWGNSEHQLRLLWWALRHGKAARWSCFKKVKEKK